MEKKYKLTKETTEINGHILHRIKALREINNDKVNHAIKKKTNWVFLTLW